MVLPAHYRKPKSNNINYSFTDYITNLGYVVFYAFSEQNNSGVNYGLTTNKFYSDEISTTYGGSATRTYTMTATINTTLKVIGDVYFIYSIGGAAASGTSNLYVTTTFKKNSTTLGSVESGHKIVGTSTSYKTFTSKLNIANQVIFKKGDTLTIVADIKNSNGASTIGQVFCHDPMNRAKSTASFTNSQFLIPIRIQD